MLQTLAFLKQEAHPHHVLWTSFANRYGGIYRHAEILQWHHCAMMEGVCACAHINLTPSPLNARLHIPGHRFVVVSDPDILPAIIGRPGLPKWSAYENVVPVKALCQNLPENDSDCHLWSWWPRSTCCICEPCTCRHLVYSWWRAARCTRCSQRRTPATPPGRPSARPSTPPSRPPPSGRTSHLPWNGGP